MEEQSPEQEQPLYQKSEPITQGEESVSEPSKLYPKKIIFDGNCDHFFMFHHVDPDGVANARCTKCPMGIVYKVADFKLVDGQQVSI